MESTATSQRTPMLEFPMTIPLAQPRHRPPRKRRRTLTEGFTIQDTCLRTQQYYQERCIPRPTVESQRDGESYASNFGSLYDDSSSESSVSIGLTILSAAHPSPVTDSGDSTSTSSDSSLWDMDIIGRIVEQNRQFRARRD
ncbi:hypothetical protein PIB30_082880 [Stylosanthes scabra]|uniref:Uncharacterized protein n=1 Tax=Stylosanthes scabra TaxID=79078 RepID=A0ABU6YPQ4_9FABA|nr:hypothetical protein [Stylosanthes scabra]